MHRNEQRAAAVITALAVALAVALHLMSRYAARHRARRDWRPEPIAVRLPCLSARYPVYRAPGCPWAGKSDSETDRWLALLDAGDTGSWPAVA